MLAHTSPDIDATTKASINSSLKNLMFFTHQNLLIVIQILLNRMVINTKENGGSSQTLSSAVGGAKKSNNYWATNLSQIINQKMIKKVRTKGEAI